MSRRAKPPARDPESAFLGTGWSFPPTFSRHSLSINMVSDELDIRESLWVLLSTALGERIMVPRYGCKLQNMVFHSMTRTLATEIEGDVRAAILYWEPRIEVIAVLVEPKATQDGLLEICIDYVIRQTNTRNNLVYPYYLLEGTLPAQLP